MALLDSGEYFPHDDASASMGDLYRLLTSVSPLVHLVLAHVLRLPSSDNVNHGPLAQGRENVLSAPD